MRAYPQKQQFPSGVDRRVVGAARGVYGTASVGQRGLNFAVEATSLLRRDAVSCLNPGDAEHRFYVVDDRAVDDHLGEAIRPL